MMTSQPDTQTGAFFLPKKKRLLDRDDDEEDEGLGVLGKKMKLELDVYTCPGGFSKRKRGSKTRVKRPEDTRRAGSRANFESGFAATDGDFELCSGGQMLNCGTRQPPDGYQGSLEPGILGEMDI